MNISYGFVCSSWFYDLRMKICLIWPFNLGHNLYFIINWFCDINFLKSLHVKQIRFSLIYFTRTSDGNNLSYFGCSRFLRTLMNIHKDTPPFLCHMCHSLDNDHICYCRISQMFRHHILNIAEKLIYMESSTCVHEPKLHLISQLPECFLKSL